MGPSSRAGLRRLVAGGSAAAFVVLHLGTMLLRGLPPSVREPIWPIVSWYGDGLLMADSWGMFARPTNRTELDVVGIGRSGQRSTLSRLRQADQSWSQRFADLRLRKIQSALRDAGERERWGKSFLAYFCGAAAPEAPLRVQLIMKEPEGPARTVLKHKCARNGSGRP